MEKGISTLKLTIVHCGPGVIDVTLDGNKKLREAIALAHAEGKDICELAKYFPEEATMLKILKEIKGLEGTTSPEGIVRYVNIYYF